MNLLVKALAILILMVTPASAEKWICYESTDMGGGVVVNKITRRVQGDCLTLGICSGANNTGILANCFEATNQEYNDAASFYKKVDPSIVTGSRVIDWTQQEIDDYANAQSTAADSALRESAKSSYDGISSESLKLKALVLVLIDEINILRQAIEDITNESAALTPKSLPDRTVSQAKTAIKNAIDAGSVDAE